MKTVTPFLMFESCAEEALNLYASVFENAEIESIERYGDDQETMAGKIMQAFLVLNGNRFRFFDSPVQHAFTFTPSISMFVDCESEEQLDRYHRLLSEGGQTLMPVDQYPFARKYTWFNDRFGISWQLSLT